jgi:hypothetical protein
VKSALRRGVLPAGVGRAEKRWLEAEGGSGKFAMVTWMDAAKNDTILNGGHGGVMLLMLKVAQLSMTFAQCLSGGAPRYHTECLLVPRFAPSTSAQSRTPA